MAPRKARVADVHEIASSMPHVTKWERDDGTDRPVYQVGGKSFVFFRTPRPDAVDPVSGDKYDDVIMIWVESENEKLALLSDDSNPFFSTPHFDGHPSVLVRAGRLGELTKQELTEIIQDAWLSRASNRRATTWLREHRLS
ncbi:MmcQ/YjbR family DNA-binding protein [Kribbella sp. VKM Ac-2571]|uniref:MmcQ/YjbR family DNA-binding protein n=1 Tax=Kribbella sp. VKM Ac-2571 TaxID=2512222 RepID=UPI001061FEBC|nr:MmcQ/YjbR family DNA-binding protein [Kribbella sp. VKM Ac-2571]